MLRVTRTFFFLSGNSNLHLFQELAVGGKTYFLGRKPPFTVGLRDLLPSKGG